MKTSSILFIALIIIIVAGGILLFQRGFFTQNVSPQKTYVIGILVRGKSYEPGVEGFKEQMKELGYVEGSDVKYDIRFVDKTEDLAPAIRDFLKEGVDLIHTYSTPATQEAYAETKTVPVVFGSMGDPVASGVIKSLQHPNTNVTGVGSQSVDLASKRVELLKELFPRAKRLAIAFTPGDIPGERSFEVARDTATRLGITMVPYYISKERPVEATAAAISRKDVDGIVISSDSATWAKLSVFVSQAAKERLPFSVFDKDMVTAGGLVGYGPDYFAVGKQAAILAHKILKGAKPQDLPIEIPGKFILAVNLKTAQAIGVTIPDQFLKEADLIIK